MNLDLQQLIEKYIEIVKAEKVNSELYKWQAIVHFQQNWDIDAHDFHNMFKKAFAKRSNLMFQNSFGFLNKLAEKMPNEAKKLFSILYKDEIPLEKRMIEYQQHAIRLLPLLKEKTGKYNLNHQQDERTISFLLTLHDPVKYYLYKDNVYQWLCTLKDVKPKEAGQKYFHFCELADEELDFIQHNEELQQLTKTFIPTDFRLDSTKLILQDILYRTMPRTEEIKKVFFEQLTDEVKALIETSNHPLSEHVWREINKNYRWISIWKDEKIDPYFLHYEIALEKTEIIVELHPEGSEEFKKYFEPFMNEINKDLHTTKVWHFGLAKNQKGNYHKISSKTKCVEYNNEVEPTVEQIQAITNRLIEFYENYQLKIEKYLSTHKLESFPFNKLNTMQTPLNQILYGPPGTGKTYNTIDKVVSICEPEQFIENNHIANKLVYDKLVNEGRVVFTTFHQTLAYEDFIEGIKPIKSEDNDSFLKYDIEPGIFRRIAKSAEKLVHVNNKTVDWDNVRYFKMSIGGKSRPDIHDYCISKNIVGLGWGGDEDLSVISSSKDWKTYRDAYKDYFPETAKENRYHIQASYIFNRMQIGDIVIITKGNHIIDAIGIVIGDYEYNDQNPTGFFHFRKVEWISINMNASPSKFFEKQISQQSIYEFYDEDVKKETFKELTSIEEQIEKKYVLIIDEINRGNVSAIFGELITLIEEDKRLGTENELTVTLPYSKEKFSVPPNLYIIGTMNTADRSVEALDTALRRRFSFVEMLPDPSLLENRDVDGIDLSKLLTIINQRIEVLVDRDHTIGHAYFMKVKTLEDLKTTFYKNILPLLQEYFYGNYAKMAMVLGEAFFKEESANKVTFAYRGEDYYDDSKKVFKLKNEVEMVDFENAIKKLIGPKQAPAQ